MAGLRAHARMERVPIDETTPPVARRSADTHRAAFAAMLADALIAGDGAAAEQVVQRALDGGISGVDVLAGVVAPAMREIGASWERGRLSVGQEHLASGICEGLLAVVYPSLLAGAATPGPEILVAAAEGERHLLGLRMVADVIEGSGWTVSFLGADLPAAELAALVRARRPAAVALGATRASVRPAVQRAVEALHADGYDNVVLGGSGVDTGLADELGVAYAADVRGVAAAVERVADPSAAPPGDPLERTFAGAQPPGDVPERLVAMSARAADLARRHARQASRYQRLAREDPLTGLWNRRALDDRLAELEARATPGALLMIDVDRFKAINDELGHAGGDRVLKGVAAALRAAVRPGDFLARHGGDEFTIILPDTTLEQARGLGDRLRAAVARSAHPPVTISIGIGFLDGDRRAALLAADSALLGVKRAGRDGIAAADA